MSMQDNFEEKIKKAEKTAYKALFFTCIALVLLLFSIYDPTFSLFQNKQQQVYADTFEDEDRIENGIHLRTGLKDAEGLMTVVNNCTNCHSAKLVTQNRMSKERWNETIKWMQEKQNLWDLGENQKIIVDYLVKNYPIKNIGRRLALTNIEWYELEN